MSIVPKGASTRARGILAPIARGLHGAGVSANAVTFSGTVLTLIGSFLIAAGQPAIALVVLLFGTLADTLDGQIARLSGGGTKLGAFLDSTFDRVSDSALCVAALVVGATRGDALLFAGGIVALVAGSIVPYIRAKAESLGLTASVGLAPREARLALTVVGVAAWAITGSLQLFAAAIALVALLSTITAIQRIAHVARALRGT
ncbi:MAG TPA: CDP-alcohol phosphatidyltransferase family protein [Candidatus Limnocylindrales bacterium]|nr:CDP-alcohol phosphatidyltransferase family protein [Candidatus Limnocylindrales bacterium]